MTKRIAAVLASACTVLCLFGCTKGGPEENTEEGTDLFSAESSPSENEPEETREKLGIWVMCGRCSYDNCGNICGQSRREFDRNGRVVRDVLMGGDGTESYTLYQYDEAGNRTRMEYLNVEGVADMWHEYTYDEAGNVLTDCYAGLGDPTVIFKNTVYTYGETGLLLQETEYKDIGMTVENARTVYDYDEAGRKMFCKKERGDGSLMYSTTYTYDGDGVLIRADHESAYAKPYYEEYAYDEEGRVLEITSFGENGKTEAMHYFYDELGHNVAIQTLNAYNEQTFMEDLYWEEL